MKKKLFTILALTALLTTTSFTAADVEPGFKPLTDGKTFDGWKMAEENQDTWKLEDGAFVAQGNRSHLFYAGDEKPFKNFHLKADVMTEPGSNGGIYFHTKYQAQGWPTVGFESQVNCTHGDPVKTGSLWGIVNVGHAASQDNKWWTQEIIVQADKVTVLVDGKLVLQYVEPPGAQPSKGFTHKLDEGTFALQGHDPKSVIRYKNIRVQRLD